LLTSKMFAGFLCFCLGHTLAWFQLNSQFVWEWWKDRPLEAVFLYAVPVGLSFWFGTKFLVEATEELWSSRLIAFAASYMVFPLLTWWLMNESPFTPKTMTCILLSCMIVAVQLFWK